MSLKTRNVMFLDIVKMPLKGTECYGKLRVGVQFFLKFLFASPGFLVLRLFFLALRPCYVFGRPGVLWLLLDYLFLCGFFGTHNSSISPLNTTAVSPPSITLTGLESADSKETHSNPPGKPSSMGDSIPLS